MENKDFDNIFKNQLDDDAQAEEFVFEDSMWDDVEAVMDREQILVAPPKKGLSKHLIWLLLLLLLSGNAFLGWQYAKTKKKLVGFSEQMEILENQVAECAAASNNSTVISSTVPTGKGNLIGSNSSLLSSFGKKNILSTPFGQPKENTFSTPSNAISSFNPAFYPSISSVIQTRTNANVENTNSSSSSFSNLGNKDALFSNSSNPFTSPNMLSNRLLNNGGTSNFNIGETIDNNPNATIGAINNPITSESERLLRENTEKNIENIALLENKLRKLYNPLRTNLGAFPGVRSFKGERKKSFAQRLYEFSSELSPNNYQLGITGGGAFLFGTDRPTTFNTNIGISTELAFGRSLKLGTGIGWTKGKLEYEDIDAGNFPDNLFNNYLLPEPNDVADRLHKVEAYSQYLEVPLYAKILLRPNNTFSPYIGGGVQAYYHYHQKYEAKYLQAPDYLVEYEDAQEGNLLTAWNLSTWKFLFGAEYTKFDNFTIQLNGSYAQDFKIVPVENRLLRRFGGNLSVLYGF